MTAPPKGYSGSGSVQWPTSNGGYDVRNDSTWHGYQDPNAWTDRYKTEKQDFAGYGGYDFRALNQPDQRNAGAHQNYTSGSDGSGGMGGSSGGTGGWPNTGGSGGSSGGGYYGGGSGGTTPGSTTAGTATGPLFSKADTDRDVSQKAAAAFAQGDPYSLKIAASGNGLSYGAGQASMMNPAIAQAGVAARTAAKTIPLQDAMANEQWMLGNQVQNGQNALDWARLGEYRNQTDQMGSDFFVKLLMGML